MDSPINIQSYTPSKGDYERLDDLLTQYSKDQGGVDYEHIQMHVLNSEENPKVRILADFLSWGSVTLTDIEILDTYQYEVAAKELFQKVHKLAESANMGSIAIENSNRNFEALYFDQGFLRSADIAHKGDLRKVFFIKSLEVNGEVALPKAANDAHSALPGTSKPYAQGFKARDADNNLLGELIGLYNDLGEFEVERIIVDSTRRTNGVGRKLMKAAEEFARDINMRSVIVASPTWQQGFVDSRGGFYEKVGYKRLVAIPLNLTQQFNGMQYNVYYKKDLDTLGTPIIDPAHALRP